MSDIKLFSTAGDHVKELTGTSMALERSLQTLMERNLEAFLGVRFLESEYSTGKTHAGRIDSLGIDENNSPVIIEYKRSLNANVINQGLFYLDWLLDHRAEFTLLAMKKFGSQIEAMVDWSSPRLICIAGDFTKYDEHAVAQIGRSIELIRYRRYGDDFMVLELVNSIVGTSVAADADASLSVASLEGSTVTGRSTKTKSRSKTVSDYLDQSPRALVDLFAATEDFMTAFGDDVTKKVAQTYIAFRRIKNFACIEVHPNTKRLLVYLKVDPRSIILEPGFTRDVSKIGHFGTGNLEVSLGAMSDLEKAKPLIVSSYEVS